MRHWCKWSCADESQPGHLVLYTSPYVHADVPIPIHICVCSFAVISGCLYLADEFWLRELIRGLLIFMLVDACPVLLSWQYWCVGKRGAAYTCECPLVVPLTNRECQRLSRAAPELHLDLER